MGLGTMEQRTEGMKKQEQELIEQAYNRGYRAGYSKAENDYHANTEKDRQSSYELGLNMAWEAVCKILRMSEKEYSSLFDTDCTNSYYRIGKLLSMSVSEAIKLVGEYEQKNQNEQEEIHVGDEVYAEDKEIKYVVTGISEESAHLVDCKGNFAWTKTYVLHKTGKHFNEIENVLKKMQEDERE